MNDTSSRSGRCVSCGSRPGGRVRPLAAGLLILTTFACRESGQTADPITAAEHAREPHSEILIGILENDSATAQRRRAALAMGRIQSPEYVEPLAAAAKGEDVAVRRAALFALGQLGLAQGQGQPPAEASQVCREALFDPDPRIVSRAVECMGKLAAPGTAEAVTPMLGHESPAVRVKAADALLRTRFVPLWRGQVDEPPPLPTASVVALGDTLRDDQDEVRRAAAHALSRYGEPEAAGALAARVEDRDEWVRLFAVRGVERAGESSVAEPIVAGLDDPSFHVRTATVSALAALGRADLVSPGLADDDSFHVRAAVASAMAGLDDEGSMAVLRTLETDRSPTVRGAAIGALATRLGATYLAATWPVIGEDVWPVRKMAANAAAGLGEDGVAVLLAAAGDPDPRVRAEALDALGTFQDRPEIDALLVEALRSADLGIRGTAIAAIAEGEHPGRLGRLTAAYDDSPGVDWIEIRETAVDAAAGIPGAESFLRRVAGEDPAPAVRARARIALETRGIEPPVPPRSEDQRRRLPDRRFKDDPVIVMETAYGSMEILCFPDDAPVHVANFVSLVEDGFYDGLIWHRVVSNFVIQGGDPLSNGWGGPGYTLPDEIGTRGYVRGTVGMPKAGKDTGGCQIFVTHVPTPHLDGNYTVFGQVVEGLEVIDRIEVGDVIERAYVKR